MLADSADLQVWLDSQSTATQTVMIPFVRSARNRQLNYRIDVIRRTESGQSHISQSGNVTTVAGAPTPLTRMSVGPHSGSECLIDVTLREGKDDVGHYRVVCP